MYDLTRYLELNGSLTGYFINLNAFKIDVITCDNSTNNSFNSKDQIHKFYRFVKKDKLKC